MIFRTREKDGTRRSNKFKYYATVLHILSRRVQRMKSSLINYHSKLQIVSKHEPFTKGISHKSQYAKYSNASDHVVRKISELRVKPDSFLGK